MWKRTRPWYIAFTLASGLCSLSHAQETSVDSAAHPTDVSTPRNNEIRVIMPRAELPLAVRGQLETLRSKMSTASLEYTVEEKGVNSSTTYKESFNVTRFYQRWDQKFADEAGKMQKWSHETAFDGSIFYFGDPERPDGQTPATLSKFLAGDVRDPKRDRSLVSFPYLNAAGFFMADRIRDYEKFVFVEPLVLHYLEDDVIKVESEGNNLRVSAQIADPILTRVRNANLEEERRLIQSTRNSSPEAVSKGIEELKGMQSMTPRRNVSMLLDSGRGYGVIDRIETTSSGEQIVRVQSDDWKYFSSAGIWLPSRCVVFHFANASMSKFSAQPIRTVIIRLRHVEFGAQASERYVLDYRKPGTLIHDRTTEEARGTPTYSVSYAVGADGTLLRDIANARRGIAQRQRQRTVVLWIGINFASLGVVVAVVYWLRRRKS